MKFIAVALLSLSAFSAFAVTPKAKIAEIQYYHNAKCTQVDQTRSYCVGSVNPDYHMLRNCTHTETYHCMGEEEDFGLKLKVKESYNFETDRREKNVTSVTFLN
jgi:hypothetical protein